jgi:hypothetical protein
MLGNGLRYKKLPIAGAKPSDTHTTNAAQNLSNTHLPGNFL